MQVQDDSVHCAGLDLVISNGISKFKTNGSVRNRMRLLCEQKIGEKLTCTVLIVLVESDEGTHMILSSRAGDCPNAGSEQ